MKKKINLAILNTTSVRIGPYTKQGTEIFDYILISGLAKHKKKDVNITAFCSSNSQIPVKKEGITHLPSLDHKCIGIKNYVYFDIALIAKAFGMQKNLIFIIQIFTSENIFYLLHDL